MKNKSFDKSIDVLSRLLADTYLLLTKTQNFHWNVIDPRFYPLHKFFEELYEELQAAVDEIAERIRMVNGKAPGSMKEFIKLSQLKEESNLTNADKMISLLAADHETICCFIHSNIKALEGAGDDGSADLLIERLRAHEKNLWMIRSHSK